MSTNVALWLLPATSHLLLQFGLMAVGVTAIGMGSAMYLTSAMGPGPRDGIMTGLHQRFAWRIRTVRTALELCVLVVGFAFGGTLGIGTVIYALVIGQVVEAALHLLGYRGQMVPAESIDVLSPDAPGH